MVCETVEQMRGMAEAGSRKMERQGYRAEPVDGETYDVSYKSRESGESKGYRVGIAGGGECTCPFFVENLPVYQNLTVCKHVLFAQRQDAIETYYDTLRAEWEGDRGDDEMLVGDHHQCGAGWD